MLQPVRVSIRPCRMRESTEACRYHPTLETARATLTSPGRTEECVRIPQVRVLVRAAPAERESRTEGYSSVLRPSSPAAARRPCYLLREVRTPPMNRRLSSRVTFGAWALLIALGGGTIGFALHRASTRRAAEAAQAERVRAAAEQEQRDRRRRELQAGIDHFAEVKAELHAFGEWIRAVRPRILAGQPRPALGDVKCTAAKLRTRHGPTCSASHIPQGRPPGIRYQVLWYRDHPVDMRAMASEVPYSPLVNCETLGLRQSSRRTEDQGQVTVLDCAVPDSTESYVIRHTVRAGSRATTVSWFSSGYLSRAQASSLPLPTASGPP